MVNKKSCGSLKELKLEIYRRTYTEAGIFDVIIFDYYIENEIEVVIWISGIALWFDWKRSTKTYLHGVRCNLII